MRVSDIFEIKESVRYSLGAYLVRISNRKTGNYAQFIMNEKLDQDAWKFIKPSEVSRLSWGTRNPDRKKMGIVTFNIPEEGIAYKAIYDQTAGDEQPTKVFSSVEEGKWTVMPDPSVNVLRRFSQERERLYNYIAPNHNAREQEGPVVFR